jgi:hypothetical protein
MLDPPDEARVQRLENAVRQLQGSGVFTAVGEGDPNGAQDGPKGSEFVRLDGSAGSLRYVKTTDAGTLTGWTAFA